jgi:hypothetical protein
MEREVQVLKDRTETSMTTNYSSIYEFAFAGKQFEYYGILFSFEYDFYRRVLKIDFPTMTFEA